MRKTSTNLMDQIVDSIISGDKTGVPAIDAQVSDAVGSSRRALPSEMEQLLKAKRDPAGARMASAGELSKLSARKKALERMGSRSIKEVGSEVGEGVGSKIAKSLGSAGKGLLKGGLGRAASIAAGPLGMMISEGADAAELNMPPEGSRDALIESPDHTAEQKLKLMRGMDAMEKARQPEFFDDVNRMREKAQGMAEAQDTRSQEELEKAAEARQRKMDILSGRKFR